MDGAGISASIGMGTPSRIDGKFEPVGVRLCQVRKTVVVVVAGAGLIVGGKEPRMDRGQQKRGWRERARHTKGSAGLWVGISRQCITGERQGAGEVEAMRDGRSS